MLNPRPLLNDEVGINPAFIQVVLLYLECNMMMIDACCLMVNSASDEYTRMRILSFPEDTIIADKLMTKP